MDFESQDFILVFLGFCGISRNTHFTGAADFPRFPEIPFSRISGIPGFPAFSTFPGIPFLAQERNSRFSRNFRVSGNPQFSLKSRFSAPPGISGNSRNSQYFLSWRRKGIPGFPEISGIPGISRNIRFSSFPVSAHRDFF